MKKKVLVSASLVACAAVVGLGVHSLRERIGQENAYCDQFDRFNTPNGQGKVISAYTTVCTTLGTTVVSYVFVHAETDHPRASNLVFRYTQAGGADPVDLKWADATHVSVTVRGVRDIDLMNEQAGAIFIRYTIQKVAS